VSISIVQKSDLARPRRNPKIALVLAGGAISGGSFKLGGVIALNRFLKNRKITDFDIYVGLSAGAFLSAFIAGGLSPEELLKGLDGTSKRVRHFKFYDFYWPDVGEFGRRGARLLRDAITVWPSIAAGVVRHLSGSREAFRRRMMDFLAAPGYTALEQVIGPLVADALRETPIPHVGRYIPAGIFDNSRIEQYVRVNLVENGIPNDFRMLQRERGISLYITATNLNTARGVVFGHDADHTVSISEAVQASTAIPGFYTPPKIRGEEYLDASVRKTANASLAMHKGADLIIAYNPFRPFMNRNRYQLNPTAASLSDFGMGTVLNQAVRSLAQSRLYLGIEKLRLDPSFRGDLILIEPTETDAEFFSLNPLAVWNRGVAARHGYNSVRRALEQNCAEVQRILAAYGLECDPGALAADVDVTPKAAVPDTGARKADEVEARERPRLTLVK